MMDRRTFLKSSVASLFAPFGGCINRDNGTECQQCQDLEEYAQTILQTPYKPEKVEPLKRLMRPERHEWTRGCRYSEVVPDENVEDWQEFFELADYDIVAEYRKGVVNVEVNFSHVPPNAVNFIDVNINTGGVSSHG